MVNRVDVNSVLMQMRQVKDQLRTQQDNAIKETVSDMRPNASQDVKPLSASEHLAQQVQKISEQSGDDTVPNFQNMFKGAIDQVNANQQAAGQLATRYEQGDPSVDLPEVMIALQKSSVSFQAMTQVRNKLVEAYKDVMNMPV